MAEDLTWKEALSAYEANEASQSEAPFAIFDAPSVMPGHVLGVRYFPDRGSFGFTLIPRENVIAAGLGSSGKPEAGKAAESG